MYRVGSLGEAIFPPTEPRNSTGRALYAEAGLL